MVFMDKEERELRIKLAEEERKLTILLAKLNADLQVQLTLDIGLAALSVAAIAVGYQFLLTAPALWNIWLPYSLIPLGIFSMLGAIIEQLRLRETRKRIRELK
jgi:uncharacterized membrane-anchored protein